MWIFISSYLQSFINHSPNSPKMFFLLFRPKIKFDLLIGLKECSELSSKSPMRREDPFSVTKPMIACVLDINFFPLFLPKRVGMISNYLTDIP